MFLKELLEKFSLSLDNHKSSDISSVNAFQKELQSPPFVVDTCGITPVVEIIPFSCDVKMGIERLDQAPKCASSFAMLMSIKGSLDQEISFSEKHLQIFFMAYMVWLEITWKCS